MFEPQIKKRMEGRENRMGKRGKGKRRGAERKGRGKNKGIGEGRRKEKTLSH